MKLTRKNYQTITTDIFPLDFLLNKQCSDVGSCENYSITFLCLNSIFQHKTGNKEINLLPGLLTHFFIILGAHVKNSENW